MAKTEVTCVKFLPDLARQKLLKSAYAAQSYSKNKSGTFFYEPRCIKMTTPTQARNLHQILLAELRESKLFDKDNDGIRLHLLLGN